jgi:hypothetical protein
MSFSKWTQLTTEIWNAWSKNVKLLIALLKEQKANRQSKYNYHLLVERSNVNRSQYAT